MARRVKISVELNVNVSVEVNVNVSVDPFSPLATEYCFVRCENLLVDANKFINKHTIVECGGYGEMHPRSTEIDV